MTNHNGIFKKSESKKGNRAINHNSFVQLVAQPALWTCPLNLPHHTLGNILHIGSTEAHSARCHIPGFKMQVSPKIIKSIKSKNISKYSNEVKSFE